MLVAVIEASSGASSGPSGAPVSASRSGFHKAWPLAPVAALTALTMASREGSVAAASAAARKNGAPASRMLELHLCGHIIILPLRLIGFGFLRTAWEVHGTSGGANDEDLRSCSAFTPAPRGCRHHRITVWYRYRDGPGRHRA